MRLRQSTLQTWMDCALEAKFKHIDNLPRQQSAAATFGTVVHHALEVLKLTGDFDRAKAAFIDKWQNPETLGVAPDYWPKRTSFDSYMALGIQCLERVAEADQWGKGRVLATEHRFLVPFGRHELEGTVDLFEQRRTGKGVDVLAVVDYKTPYKQPTVAELALNIQFTVYDYASRQREFWVGNGEGFPPIENGEWLFETLNDLPRRNIWFHVRTAKEMDAGERDWDDFERLYLLINEIERAIEHKVFVPRIGEACERCDHVADCGLSIPSREELNAEEAAWI